MERLESQEHPQTLLYNQHFFPGVVSDAAPVFPFCSSIDSFVFHLHNIASTIPPGVWRGKKVGHKRQQEAVIFYYGSFLCFAFLPVFSNLCREIGEGELLK